MAAAKLGYRDAVSVNRNSIHTGIWRLLGPGGRTVLLVGTMHIGEERYYKEISSLLSTYRGESTQIHFEKISHDLSGATSDEATILSEIDLSSLGVAMKEFARPLGWVYQSDSLVYPDTAINVDTSAVHLLRRLGRRKLENIVKSGSGLEGASRKEASSVLRKALRLIPIAMWAARTTRSTIYQTLLLERNALALQKGEEGLRDGNTLVLVWGAAHLPDMAKRLRKKGYRLESNSFLKVGSLE